MRFRLMIKTLVDLIVPCSILVFVGKKWSLEKWTNCSLVLEKIRGMLVCELLFGKMWGVL